MRKIREILRLKYEGGLSNRAITRACCISNSTVGEYVDRNRRGGLAWPVVDELGEEELTGRLGVNPQRGNAEIAVAGISGKTPGWVWIYLIPGALSALESGTQPACVYLTRDARRWRWIIQG